MAEVTEKSKAIEDQLRTEHTKEMEEVWLAYERETAAVTKAESAMVEMKNSHHRILEDKDNDIARILKKHESSFIQLQQQHDDLLARNQEYETSMNRTKSTYDRNLRIKRDKFARSEAELRRAYNLSTQQVQKAHEEITMLEDSLENIKVQFVQEKEGRARLEATLGETREELNNLEMVNEALSEQLTSEVATLKVQLTQTTAALAERDKKIKSLEKQLDSNAKSLKRTADQERSGLSEISGNSIQGTVSILLTIKRHPPS